MLDRIASPRGAMTLQFLAFGFAIGLWSGSVPTVARTTGIGPVGLGIVITLYTVAYILSMSLAGWITNVVSAKRILVFANPMVAILFAAVLAAPGPVALGLALVAFGLIGGTIDLLMNAEGTRVEADLKGPVLARLHASASAGLALGALGGSVAAGTVGTWPSALSGFVVLGAAAGLILKATPERDQRSSGGARSSTRFTITASLLSVGLAVGISIAGETAAQLWSAKLLEEQAPRLAVIAGIGAAFFAACQSAIRFSGDFLRRRTGDRRLVAISFVIGMAGFALVALSTGIVTTVVGFSLIGAGTALIVPCAFALSVAAAPGAGAAALSFVALIAGMPRMAAPYVFGETAAALSTGAAFGLFAAAFLAGIGLTLAVDTGKRTA